ncbi:MAG: hypothetical protein ABIF08_03520 [Nanoarchaeota archaeon]
MNSAYILLYTPPWILAGIPFAVAMAIVTCITIAEKIPQRLNMMFLFFMFLFGAMVTISLLVWQYAARESGWWILVLAGTLIEILSGWVYYSSKNKEEQRLYHEGQSGGSKLFFYSFLYMLAVVILVAGGTFAWANGMMLSMGEAPIIGMVVIFIILLMIVLSVGYFSYLVIEGMIKPLLMLVGVVTEIHNIQLTAVHKLVGIKGNRKDVSKYLFFIRRLNPPASIITGVFHYFRDCLLSTTFQESEDIWTIAIVSRKRGLSNTAKKARKDCVDELVAELKDSMNEYSGDETFVLAKDSENGVKFGEDMKSFAEFKGGEER